MQNTYPLVFIFALLFSGVTIAQELERPKLVVGIMVDQMLGLPIDIMIVIVMMA